MIHDTNNIIDLLESGIRAEGLRHQAIAQNIANMNTPGYRRSDVNFEEVLNKVMQKESGINPDKMELEFVQTKDSPLNEFGNDVSLDTEVSEMIKNSIKHRTYMLTLKKMYQQMENALRVP